MSLKNEVVARKSCDMTWCCRCHHVLNYSLATLSILHTEAMYYGKLMSVLLMKNIKSRSTLPQLDLAVHNPTSDTEFHRCMYTMSFAL